MIWDALRRSAEPGVSGALLLRDASRSARRWQTYGTRTAFSAVILGVIITAIWFATVMVDVVNDTANLPYLARGIFITFAVIQVMLACLFAPFGVARAVIEEREQNTLELLMLTRLEARQILIAKVFARLLVLLMVILGAMPVLGLITSLGGVSVVEVVAVTAHAIIAVLVLGVMGGFFAVFTRSPIVATLASLAYGFCAFALMPFLYWMLTFDYQGLAHFSPLFGTIAQDWWSLLPVVSYAPVILMVFALGARLFELRVTNARLRHFFSSRAWGGVWMKWLGIVLVVTMFLVLPIGAVISWSFSIQDLTALTSGVAQPPLHPALWLLKAAGRTTVWMWCVGALIAGTWLYMRVAMDMVMMADEMLAPSRTKRELKGEKKVRVWGNPVAWRELRSKALKVVAPTIGVWLLVLVGVFQMGIWVIPGGLLGIGGINAAAAIILTVWLATGAIEQERRDGTLEVLLTSTMSSPSILFGKGLGVAAPTGALLAISLPMVLLGAPHLHFYWAINEPGGFFMATMKGLAGFGWIMALWLFVLVGSMAVALVLRKPRAAYGLSMTVLFLGLLVPPLTAGLARGIVFIEYPARWLVPVLVARPNVIEMVSSMMVLMFFTLVVFVISCFKLREWGLRHA